MRITILLPLSAFLAISPELVLRASAAVDPSLIPSDCFLSDLIGLFGETCATTKFDCPALSTPCAKEDKDCHQYETDCFCKLPRPLNCAWACGWRSWMGVEDWYEKTCGKLKTINFGLAPKCARGCLEDGTFNYGCLKFEQTCFCRHGELFGCEQKCSKSEKVDLQTWVKTQCEFTGGEEVEMVHSAENTATSTTTAALATGTGDKGRPIKSSSVSHPLKWYEIMVVTIALYSFVSLIAAGIYICWFNKTKPRRKGEKDELEKTLSAESGKAAST